MAEVREECVLRWTVKMRPMDQVHEDHGFGPEEVAGNSDKSHSSGRATVWLKSFRRLVSMGTIVMYLFIGDKPGRRGK